MAAGRFTAGQLNRLLQPRSVAIVGASDKPGALGATLLSNLLANGFAGPIHLINPNRETIAGLPCLPSVAALPEGVDCAVLAVPRPAVVATLEALAARKVGAAIIFAAGFAEAGAEGLAEQREIARIAAEAGMVIEGPNCLGSVNHVDRVPLTFVETRCRPPSGPGVAIISQSGAMAAVLATILMARDVPVSYSVSTGNEAASGVEDYVAWLVDDPHTHVVAMIVEQFRQPQAFLAAARALRAAGKMVVLLHPGTSGAARESAATHTGAMAGDYQLMRTQVGSVGVVFAETLEELGDISEIALRCPALPRPGAAVLGESGAFKALTLDLAEQLGLALAPLGDADSPALRTALPPFVPVSNPLDLTAHGLYHPEIYTDVISSLLDDPRVGSIVAGIIQSDPVTCAIKFPPIMAAIAGRTLAKPLIFAGLDEGADVPAERIAALRAAGIPWFPSTERALRALARLAAPRPAVGPVSPAPAIAGLAGQRGVIPEYRAKALLAPCGIPFPAGRFAASADEAVAAAEAIGYPVAMKAQAAALGHKSEAGGVLLALGDASAVRAAFARIHANVAAFDAGIILDGVLIEAMGARGTEMIIGARHDPEWGPVVLAGFGGVTAEILQDVRLIPPGLAAADVIAELLTLKQAPLLTGWRGSPALDLPALAALIVRLGAILAGNPGIREIDLNPVILHPTGLVALDALMLVD